MTKIINLVGAPGAGKSTTASGLFNIMKLTKKNVELTQEWVKGAVWEERYSLLDDQLYITAKQNRQLHRLLGKKLDYIISDSPLFLGAIYAPKDYLKSYGEMVFELFNRYENIVYYINRVKPYCPLGRVQTEEESREVENKLLKYMKEREIAYKSVNGDEEAAKIIFDDVCSADKRCKICDRKLSLEHDVYIDDSICNFCQIS